MAVTIDRACIYQFGLSLDEPARDLALDGLPAKVAAGEGLALKFGGAQMEQAFVAEGNGPLVPARTITWRGGVWRMTWTPIRLDLFFDARAYADVRGDAQIPSLATVRNRVAENFSSAAESLGQRIHRMVLVVNMQASKEAAAGSPTKVVAANLSTAAREAAGDGLLDLMTRVNSTATFKLGDRDTLVNRIETSAANWQIEGRQGELSLGWGLDVNTSPLLSLDPDVRFDANQVRQFFAQAEPWIAERLLRLTNFT